MFSWSKTISFHVALWVEEWKKNYWCVDIGSSWYIFLLRTSEFKSYLSHERQREITPVVIPNPDTVTEVPVIVSR